ncbi:MULTISPECIES: response regulator [unclassified Leptolyngbya]|uniref:response regulator n=1 Tax=unclassified Leptolyngbya TaxID=2650499 RepID=UPI001685E6EA|nr:MULTISPECIES: response regulator [unclassified Leptolyngbya]MBD1910115.1 response regulator [Leptolyngbya sp. FACHB-8]MBD2156887.1 response regulator [Leptolyngbya sp. FACHB-16]
MTPYINPWNSPLNSSEANSPDRLENSSGKPTILIVEDDPDNAFLARYISETAGYISHAASSGNEALGLLDRHQYDLMLLDIVLPDIDGFGILQEVRQRYPTTKMPIIAVTAMAYHWQQQHIIEAGFDGYLCKPYTLEAMETLLLKYCSCKSSL